MGPMRGLTVLGDTVIAFGMNRHVYVADGSIWRRFEHGFSEGEIDFAALLDSMGGANAVTHLDDHFIAVGMKGEIWRSVGETLGETRVACQLDEPVVHEEASVPLAGFSGFEVSPFAVV